MEGFHPPKPAHVAQYLVVTARYGGAAVDLARSRIRYADEPPTCEESRNATKNAIHGFTLEPGTCRGEDIFRPRGLTGRRVISESFARFVERHGFTNMTLVTTEELIWDPLELGPPGLTGASPVRMLCSVWREGGIFQSWSAPFPYSRQARSTRIRAGRPLRESSSS
ncbi:hypothetical protein [Archangium minus]|uniref:hypothetical protein n=1 Tax=Archangium minus TaxID=83450 RepID=UPI0037C11C13